MKVSPLPRSLQEEIRRELTKVSPSGDISVVTSPWANHDGLNPEVSRTVLTTADSDRTATQALQESSPKAVRPIEHQLSAASDPILPQSAIGESEESGITTMDLYDNVRSLRV